MPLCQVHIPQVLLCVSARRPANPTIASCVDPHQPADIRGQAGVLEVGDNNNFMINLKYFIVQVVNDVALFDKLGLASTLTPLIEHLNAKREHVGSHAFNLLTQSMNASLVLSVDLKELNHLKVVLCRFFFVNPLLHLVGIEQKTKVEVSSRLDQVL